MEEEVMASISDSSDYENRRQYLEAAKQEAARKRREEVAKYVQVNEMKNYTNLTHNFEHD